MSDLSFKQQEVMDRFASMEGATQIERQEGGYWTIGGVPHEEWYVSTGTVEALFKKGILQEAEYKTNRFGRFVVAYRLTGQL